MLEQAMLTTKPALPSSAAAVSIAYLGTFDWSEFSVYYKCLFSFLKQSLTM